MSPLPPHERARIVLYIVIAGAIACLVIILGTRDRAAGDEPAPPLDCHAGACVPASGPSSCEITPEGVEVCVNVPEPAPAAPAYAG